jgi:O-Antigen ligase
MKTVALFAILFVLAALTTAAVIVGDGSFAIAIAPALALAALYATWKLPLRYPTFILTFLVLTLENPSEAPAEGLWRSPLYQAGAVLLTHLNLSGGPKWLIFSGVDLALMILLSVVFCRWLMRSRIDRNLSESARPLRLLLAVSLGGAAWMWIWGMAQGGADVASSLWQVQHVIYLPIFAFVFLIAMRGPADRMTLGKIFVVAACIKAVLAIYIRATVAPPPGEEVLGYATTHEDSMLFAGAFCLLVVPLFEKLDAKRLATCVLLLPLLAAGMIANHRRIAWVELGAALVVVFALTPWTGAKRAMSRAAVLSSPLALFYVAIGWGSTASIFQPVQVIRSIVDSDVDPSTAWRDWENYDLFFTLRQSPLLGTGYGHGYIEKVALPDISQSYALYRFLPHNAILGLWVYGGFVGFAALWTMLVVGVFFAARAHAFATKANDRAAALSAIAAIVIYFVHCYGDMGLGTWTSVFTVAPALAVAGQLAVSTGAWSLRAPVRITDLKLAPLRQPDAPLVGALLPEGASS